MARALGGARLLIMVWLAASAVLTVTQLWASGRTGEGLYLAVAAGAVAAAWIAAARLPSGDRSVGSLIAAAVTVTALGDLTSFAIGWRAGAEPAASAADLWWVASYVLLGASLLVLLRRGGGRQRRDIDGLIDAAAVFVAGMMVIWTLAISATLTDPSLPVLVRVLWGLYPVMDLALLVLVLRLFLRDRTTAAVLMGGGISLWLAADFAYLVIADPVTYGVALDIGWQWAMILFALVVVVGPSARLRRRRPRRQPAVDEKGLARISLALLPLLVPPLIELQWLLRGHDGTPAITIPGGVLLVVLAFLRVARLAYAARQARSALASRERYASALAANSSDAVAVLDADLRMTNDCPQLAALVDRPAGDVCRSHLLSLVAPEYREETRAALRRCLATYGRVFHLELRLSNSRGRQTWMAARMVNLLTDPDVRGIVVTLHDISDRKRAEEELNHQAFHDALTGLANRALFRDRLDHARERGRRVGGQPAVIFLDLDGFKAVNDRLGHDLGDDLLREVGVRLTAAVGPGETVGRLGGDEFAVLIEEAERPLAEAIAAAERILRALREPVLIDGRSITISASLGIALGDRSGSTDLSHDADVAMYRAKATGKGRWTVYRPGMRTAARERLDLENAMQRALDRDEFRVAYQPVVDLGSERIVGFEALLRWQHPTRGHLLPDDFIPLAEETGLIVPIGHWVLQQALRTVSRWRHELGREDLTIAVNLSARQLADPDLVRDVTEALDRSDLRADSLVLEATETALVEDTTAAAARLRRLHVHGVQIAIDDFGTGYSSLSYLRHFPVDILKIDRSFVRSIPEVGDFPPVVRGVLELARTLALRTCAEGVERDFQRDRLRDEQCDLAQGYLFGRPMPASQAGRFIGLTTAAEPAPAGMTNRVG